MSTNHSAAELYGAANMLRENCLEYGICNINCCFYKEGQQNCPLNKAPGRWKFFREKRWPDSDVALAKALQMMGYTHVYAGKNFSGERYVQARKNEIEGCTEIADIPKRSFQNVTSDNLYSLAEIIREAEEDNNNE